MHIGALRVELFISESRSLKHKRSVIRGIKDRMASAFNVSVAEVGDQDKWQRAVLGIAAVGSDRAYVNGILDKALDLIRGNPAVHIVDFEMELY
jgi:uncharacterized protein YlxP (DUF503 family)